MAGTDLICWKGEYAVSWLPCRAKSLIIGRPKQHKNLPKGCLWMMVLKEMKTASTVCISKEICTGIIC